ncbi:MAG: nucleoside hydrolase [Dehalococcoidia bacterium]
MRKPVAVLLDTDIGYDIDDEWALAACLTHPRINLLGVATVHGNTVARAVLSRWLVEAAGKTVEVAAGEGDTLTHSVMRSRPKRMAAIPTEDEARLKQGRTDGVAFLAEEARAFDGDELVLLTVGPLTNAAKLLTEHPEAAARITRITAMVGSLLPGRTSPEYNARVDAEATRIAFESGKPLTMIGLDVTLRCRFTQADLGFLAQSSKPLTHRLLTLTRAWQNTHRAPDGSLPMPILHDPLAALFVAEPEILTLTPMRIVVDDDGRTLRADGEPNCLVATDVRPDRVAQRLKDLLA